MLLLKKTNTQRQVCDLKSSGMTPFPVCWPRLACNISLDNFDSLKTPETWGLLPSAACRVRESHRLGFHPIIFVARVVLLLVRIISESQCLATYCCRGVM